MKKSQNLENRRGGANGVTESVGSAATASAGA